VAQVVDNAFAPFRKAVEDAGLQEVVADLSAIRVIERKPALDVFGIDVTDVRGNPLMVDIWNHPAAPAVDPMFIWTRPILEDLLGVQETGENLWFGGDRGTGKSETARQFAARTGRNFARVNYHKHSSADEFIGAVGLENGATVFKAGSFLQAYMTPSTVILNDEISNAPEGELATLNPLLEPNCAVIYGGAVRRRAPGVMIFAADNTLGCGDESGRYAGTRTMNSALVDRFARVLHFQYLPLAEEIKAVMNHTGCSEALAEHVLTAVRVAREKVTEGEIIDAPSIRSVVAFIRALKVKQPANAWSSCIVARQPAESRTALEAIYSTYIDAAFVYANI
jgi:MoxR-like ATPase